MNATELSGLEVKNALAAPGDPVPTTAAPPAAGSSKLPMLAGIAVGSAVLLAGGGYALYRYKKGQTSDGNGGKNFNNFQLDFDGDGGDAYLSNYVQHGNEMSVRL